MKSKKIFNSMDIMLLKRRLKCTRESMNLAAL